MLTSQDQITQPETNLLIGVLALQGAFAKHIEKFNQLDSDRGLSGGGVKAVAIRSVEELKGCAGLVIPGGESTVISQLLETSGLMAPVSDWVNSGKPTWGTCAGMIILASGLANPTPSDSKVAQLGAIDIAVERNSYGRQIDSFEANIEIKASVGEEVTSVNAVFVRAPKVTEVGEGVEVLARYEETPVLVRQGNAMASSFHPELTDDLAVHRLFVALLAAQS